MSLPGPKSQLVWVLVLLLYCTLHYSVGQEDLLSVEPDVPVVKFGEPLTLLCKTKCTNFTKLAWETSLASERKTEKNMSTLHIYNITQFDAIPLCYANCFINGKREQRTKKIKIFVYKLSVPVLTMKSEEMVGKNVSINCSVSDSYPPAILRLRGENKVLEMKENVITGKIEHTFTAGTENNRKKFTCEAEMKLPGNKTSESVSTIFNVFYAPTVQIHVLPKNISQGDNITINCTADSNPSASYNWTYPLLPNVYIFSDASVIQISKVTSANNGKYTCRASNQYGKVVHEVQIQLPDEKKGNGGDGSGATAGLVIMWCIVAAAVVGGIATVTYFIKNKFFK